MAEAFDETICVIIAAKNAADTIGLAVASALREGGRLGSRRRG